jgi:hypothetical protein
VVTLRDTESALSPHDPEAATWRRRAELAASRRQARVWCSRLAAATAAAGVFPALAGFVHGVPSALLGAGTALWGALLLGTLAVGYESLLVGREARRLARTGARR